MPGKHRLGYSSMQSSELSHEHIRYCSKLKAFTNVLFVCCFHKCLCFSLGSLIFLNPTLEQLSFWEVLWIVGITDFILKFFFMGLKCLVLLVPSFIVPFKSKVRN